MTLHLPESFQLPTSDNYDTLVDDLHDEIIEEGGAEFLLGKVRYERRNSPTFHIDILQPMAKLALGLEIMKPGTRVAEDSDHLLANSVVSGMLFGNLMNESFYPLLNMSSKFKPYSKLFVYSNMMGDLRSEYDASGQVETLLGRRIGYRAMSNFVINQMSDESLTKINSWSDNLVTEPALKPFFLQGVGMSFFTAWDIYSDLMIRDGRGDEVMLVDDLAQNS